MDCIVNVTENWGIGLGGKLLVSVSADLRRFRALTEGKTVILGRKTLSTFPSGRPLKNRRNLVLSAQSGLTIEGAEVYPSVAAVLDAVKGNDPQSVMVIGGERVYRAFLPYCRHAFVTKTCGNFPADRFFPDLDKLPNWHAVRTSEVFEENGVTFVFVDYENSAPIPE